MKESKIEVKRAKENIIDGKAMRKIIKDVFDDLSRMIQCTIGPCAGNTLVTEPFGSVPIFPTKDGFKVMNNHNYDDLYYESIYRIIRDVSGRTNEYLGDSTTSSVVIADDLYDRIDKYIHNHKNITPYGAKKIMDVSLEVLTKYLKDPANKYIASFDDLKDTLDIKDKIKIYRNIATISANNDSDIADKVVSAYERSNSDYAYIDVQESPNEKDIVETNLGFELATGYILRHMANKPDGVTAEYENPFFLLIDGPILKNDVGEIEKFIKWSCVNCQRPLVIFASEFCKDVCDLFVRCCTGYPLVDKNGKTQLFKLPVIGVMLNTASEYGVERIQDLEACLGARCLQTNTGRLQNCPETEEEFLLLVGRADSIKSVPHYTRIRGGAGNRAIREGRIKEIEDLIRYNKDAAQHGMNEMMRLTTLQKRAGMLQGEMHCIKVGGDSYKEKQNRKMIFDDAIQAVKACISNGVTLGGNVSVSKCISEHRNEIVEEIYKIVTDPKNTYNVMVNTKPKRMIKIIGQILDIISEASKAGFKAVFRNASNSFMWKHKIFKHLEKSVGPETYDIIKTKYVNMDWFFNCSVRDSLDPPTLIVPGNTDIEVLKSAFVIVGMFISSNQILSVHVAHDNKV